MFRRRDGFKSGSSEVLVDRLVLQRFHVGGDILGDGTCGQTAFLGYFDDLRRDLDRYLADLSQSGEQNVGVVAGHLFDDRAVELFRLAGYADECGGFERFDCFGQVVDRRMLVCVGFFVFLQVTAAAFDETFGVDALELSSLAVCSRNFEIISKS